VNRAETTKHIGTMLICCCRASCIGMWKLWWPSNDRWIVPK